MLLDVIVPTFKPGFYIDDLIASLNAQICDKKLFKVTFVLNGSELFYLENLDSKLSKCSFEYKLFFLSEAGVSNARNYALDHTDFPYVFFVDDDDLISENIFRDFFNVIHQDPGNLKNIIFLSNVYSFYNDPNEKIPEYLTLASSLSTQNIFLFRKFLSNACSKFIPRSTIQNSRFETDLIVGEDSVFMFEISKRVSALKSINMDTIYFRRLRPNSASRRKYSFYRKNEIYSKLFIKYLKFYCSDIKSYNFLLFISRVFAILKIYFKR